MVQSTPIILIAGVAGSGKDTVGNLIANHYNGICLGQADPMKKFCKDVFEFTEEQLWGESGLRNAAVEFSKTDENRERAWKFGSNEVSFRESILQGEEVRSSEPLLRRWFENMMREIRSTGKLSPRHALQQLGTEWGRKVNPQMWNEAAIRTCKTLLAGDHTYSRVGGLVKDPGKRYDYAVITDGRFANEILNVRYQGGVALKIERNGTSSVGSHSSELELHSIPRHFFTRIVNNNHSLGWLSRMVKNVMVESFDDQRTGIYTTYEVSQ